MADRELPGPENNNKEVDTGLQNMKLINCVQGVCP